MKMTNNEILDILDSFVERNGKFPSRRDLRELNIPEKYIYREFGSLLDLRNWYNSVTKETSFKKNITTLVVPDCHVGPNQNLNRFKILNKLILDKRPDNIIFMGDFITLESLSNWDLNKAGIMEGRRYNSDIEAGREALMYTLNSVKDYYKPKIIYLIGNHEIRLERYIESKPELGEHLDIIRDLRLKELGIDVIVPYKEFYNIEGVDYCHAPSNAANQLVSGKFALHRASEMTNNSMVFAHTHRKECMSVHRHGMDGVIQIKMVGAFFEHIDDYAQGGIVNYHRGCEIHTHWKPGRFDSEEFSLERLYMMY